MGGFGFGSHLRKKKGCNHSLSQSLLKYFWWKMRLVLTICHIIRPRKCEHCTMTYSYKITLVLFQFCFLGGRWSSKILCNIWRWYVKILTIPYRGRWVGGLKNANICNTGTVFGTKKNRLKIENRPIRGFSMV